MVGGYVATEGWSVDEAFEFGRHLWGVTETDKRSCAQDAGRYNLWRCVNGHGWTCEFASRGAR